MNRCLNTALVWVALLVGCASESKQTQQSSPPAPTPHKAAHFGEPMKLTDADAVPVGKVIASPGSYDGKYTRVSGQVTKVCPHKGCWMEITDSTTTETLFVKFEDPEEGRLIPMEAVGQVVVVEGVVKVKEISEEHARHYKEEGGATPQEVAKIVGPQKRLMMTDPRAQIAGVSN